MHGRKWKRKKKGGSCLALHTQRRDLHDVAHSHLPLRSTHRGCNTLLTPRVQYAVAALGALVGRAQGSGFASLYRGPTPSPAHVINSKAGSVQAVH